MRARTIFTVTAAIFAAFLASAVAAGAVSPASKAGLAPVLVRGATYEGPASARAMSVTIALSPRNQAGLSALLHAQGAGTAAPISSSQYNARFAPSRRTIAAVGRWASRNGLRVSSVSSDRQLVLLTGSSRSFGRAFRVQLARYREANGTSFRSPTTTARLPASFAAATTSVVGLSSLGRVRLASLPHIGGLPNAGALPHVDLPSGSHTAATPGLNFPASYGPKDFWAPDIYNAPGMTTASGASGAGQNVAVIAEGDLSGPKADLPKFESTFGLPTVTWNTIQVGGASSDTSGNDEWDLDTQYSTGFAPNVSNVYVYDGKSLSNADILSTITRWVTDNKVAQASFSAGECELLAAVSGFTASLDGELAHAAAQGQTLYTSSGDTGSFCPAVIGVNGVPAGIPGPSYPASSPYAIGVGGTTILGPGPTETSWYAGGGGASAVEPTPSWQQSAGGSFVGAIGRGVPDVSLDADPNSGYDVFVAGQETVIGGTSASAPSWQGIWARAQASHGGTLGFAGPVIYGKVPASAFHDITLGTNGIYPATPGWDYDTGRGTPDITALLGGA